MTALVAIAALIVAALIAPKLQQPNMAPARKPGSLSADAIFAGVAAKLREANTVIEFPQAKEI